MTEPTPPDIETLRAFVRGELPDTEKSRIYRWLVRCPDPALPSVLFNLHFEWEQEKADVLLAKEARDLSIFFLTLWEKQSARFDAIRPMSRQQSRLKYADAEQEPPEGIALTRLDDGSEIVDKREFRVEAFASSSRRRAVGLWTSDDENQPPECFFEKSLGAAHARCIFDDGPFLYERSDGRITFWFVAADESATVGTVPTSPDLILDWLRRLQGRDDCIISALRLTPRALTDLYE